MKHLICLLTIGLALGTGCDDSNTTPDTTPDPKMDATADITGDASKDITADITKDSVVDLDMMIPSKTCAERLGARPWSICKAESTTCEVVFEDGTGCAEVCRAMDMVCADALEDDPGMCAAQTDLPALGCMPSGHQSDYCVCKTTNAPSPDMGMDSGMDLGDSDMSDMTTDLGNRPKHEALLDELVGFGEGTTGGAGGPVVTVTTLADSGPGSLREAATQAGRAWIRFQINGVIQLSSPIEITNDKTIDGRGADITIAGYGLRIQNGSRNVILNNLKLRDSKNDLIRLYNGSDYVWVHHCDLSNGGDGAFDATEDSSFVTVSMTHIFDHDKAMLIGAGSDDGDGERMRWTGHHNWYERVVQRMPAIRFGRAHSYNNIFEWQGGTAMSSRLEPAQLLVENNVFKPLSGVGRKVISQSTTRAASKLVGNLERPLPGDMISFMETRPETVFTPPYTYTLDVANDALIAKVKQNAGWQNVPWPR